MSSNLHEYENLCNKGRNITLKYEQLAAIV